VPSDPDLKRHLTEVGVLLGVFPRPDDTPDSFAARVKAAARTMKAAAGITWADYVCADGAATIVPRGSPATRWHFGKGDGLDELAGDIGMYEDLTTP
jgi:hypothetical protein